MAEVGAISELGRAEDSELDELEKGAFANGELEVDSGTDEPGMGAVTSGEMEAPANLKVSPWIGP